MLLVSSAVRHCSSVVAVVAVGLLAQVLVDHQSVVLVEAVWLELRLVQTLHLAAVVVLALAVLAVQALCM